MTTWEARELATWLRALSDANPGTGSPADAEAVQFWLTEPNLVFALAAIGQGVTTIEVCFDAESRPPGCSSEDHDGLGHSVRLKVPHAELAAAVAEWERDLRAFPIR